jgi:GDPmannose 4,6-dehydratase
LGLLDRVELGNLDARRDWGFAEEYVQGMYQMLQVDEPDTFVLATGRTETVRDFVTMAFRAVNIDLAWKGQGTEEQGIDRATGQPRVVVNPKFYRPAEVDLLIGNPQKAKQTLGWEARTSLEQLCKMMVEADLRRCRSGVSF